MTRRIALSVLAAGSLAFASACGTEPTMPGTSQGVTAPTQARVGVTSTLATVETLVAGQEWRTALGAPVTVSATVTPSTGAVLRIPQLGVSVVIPRGAVESPMVISMTALAGSVVAFDFQPAGTTFNAPLRVTQDLALTVWNGAPFDVVYFKSSDDIDKVSKKVKVSEVIPVSLAGTAAAFDIWHFSGYAVSAGRM